MPQHISDGQLGEAVLQSVHQGIYPDSEEIISAEFPSSAFLNALDFLEDARREVKDDIRELSRDCASDVDDWLAQARQLRDDIEKSKSLAREILQYAEDEKRLQERVTDAANKASLLDAEVNFNASLAEALELMHLVENRLDVAHESILANQVSEAIGGLNEAEEELESLRNFETTNVVGLLHQRIAHLRGSLGQTLEDHWNTLITVDRVAQVITVRQNVESEVPVDVQHVVKGLDSLQMLKAKVDALYQCLDMLIIRPRLNVAADNTVAAISVKGDNIQIDGRQRDVSVENLFSDLILIFRYLSAHLPPSIAVPLSDILMPSLLSTLISSWLASSVPSSLQDMGQFQQILTLAGKFRDDVDSLGWTGASRLTEWIDDAPKVWLTERRENSLLSVRTILAKGFGTTRTVERAETQKISREEDMFTGNAGSDWDAAWSDEEHEGSTNGVSEHSQDDEEDVSAWGLDDDSQHEGESESARRGNSNADEGDNDDAEDAWGWGDEGSITSPTSTSPKKTKPPKQPNSGHAREKADGREVTLKEMFTLTAIPESILELVQQIISDYESLSGPDFRTSPIAPAAPGLTALPTLLIAFYRASASLHYRNDPSGNMYLYNDSLWLSDQLRTLHDDQTTGNPTQSSRGSKRFKLEADVKSLDLFGKRAYAKEMESQRIILSDLLDVAQGFTNCTVYPFADACETAICSTVDRIRAINSQWKGILSNSALLQSLGSLLSTVTNKIIVDVEDMGDISEPESQRLAHFCTELSKLEDLFVPSQGNGASQDNQQAAVPLTAVYVSTWLKFQYLASILESSLADIKYLWSEGELRLEFSAEELVDLIEALFADSDYRRKAIADIRRSSRSM
ncbi:MAG: hypothetical protein M1837_000925 [Sclerophora amabilis]|nr:MAG: hypothetical protein M1837_000925 [Sclerophora amabilis]